MLSLHEVIDKQLERLDKLFVEQGEWTGGDFAEMVQSLHEALRLLAEKEDNTFQPQIKLYGWDERGLPVLHY